MSTAPWSGLSLAEAFGYFEDSESNTLALIKTVSSLLRVLCEERTSNGKTLTCLQLGLARHDSSHGGSPSLTPEAADEVQRNIECMPDRRILDFLVQFFVEEINWCVSLRIHTSPPPVFILSDQLCLQSA